MTEEIIDNGKTLTQYTSFFLKADRAREGPVCFYWFFMFENGKILRLVY